MEGANNKMNDNVVRFFAMFSITRAQNDVRECRTPKPNQTDLNQTQNKAEKTV